jgi:hypothetical protein
MRIACDIQFGVTTGDYYSADGGGGHATVPTTEATCSRCGHQTESYGNSGASVRRCLALMREECPRGGANFYVASGGEDHR